MIYCVKYFHRKSEALYVSSYDMQQEHSLAMVFKAKVSEKKTYMITKDIYYSRKYHTGIYVMMCWPIKDNILLTVLQKKKEKSCKGI